MPFGHIFSGFACLTEFVDSIKQIKRENTPFSSYAFSEMRFLCIFFSLNNDTLKSFSPEFCSDDRVLIVELGLTLQDSEY